MTGRSTAQGRRTRERMVSGAAELIYEQGVEKTSVDQILARTSTSKSQLYHYFTDKDGLVQAVIAHQAERVLEESSPVMEAVRSWATLRAWFDAIVAAQQADECRHGCPVGSIAAEVADYNDKAREELSQAFKRWELAIREVLDRLKANGRLSRRADTQPLAAASLAAIQGGLLLSKTVRDVAPLRAALDANYAHLRSFANAHA